jgi:hypothetical protein
MIPKWPLSGEMMATGLSHLLHNDQDESRGQGQSIYQAQSDYGEWADELAIISRRRNVLERKLRGVVGNFIRFSSMNDASAGSAKDRVLKCVDARRRAELQRFELDDLMTKLFWLELIAVVKKEWLIFERLFGDRDLLDRNTSIVNERPDAHAKELDLIDAALHRSAIEWFEGRLGKI